ncbi:MAG TPA: glycosyltransferase family 87 protein [Bryobacteraceae bacterium]|jgi:hypothetical protein
MIEAIASGQAAISREATRKKVLAGVFVAIGTALVMWIWIIGALKSPQTGWDFPVFYIPAHLPVHLLYSRDAFAAFWREHLSPLGVPHWAPYVRPAIFSLLLRPLSALPYQQAMWLWLAGGVTAYFAAIAVLIRRFKLPGFLFTAYAAFFPALAGTVSGADITVYLLALTLALVLLECRRDGLAGCALIVGLCKFNLIMLIPVVLLFHRRFRAFMFLAGGAVFVAASSMVLTPLGDYIAAMIDAPRKTAGFFPVGLKGFSTAIGQPWCYPVLVAIILVVCCGLMRRLPFTEAFCIAVTGSLLIVPYVTWYDSTLLALPLAVIYARGGTVVRIICVSVLAAVPLWLHGGGYNGPIGFMHVGVELFILGYFAYMADLCRLSFRALGSPGTNERRTIACE